MSWGSHRHTTICVSKPFDLYIADKRGWLLCLLEDHLHEESTSIRLLLHHVAYNCSLFSKWHLILSLISTGSLSILIYSKISPKSSPTTLHFPTIKRSLPYYKDVQLNTYSFGELWFFALPNLYSPWFDSYTGGFWAALPKSFPISLAILIVGCSLINFYHKNKF